MRIWKRLLYFHVNIMGREWCWDHPFFAGTYALHCVPELASFEGPIYSLPQTPESDTFQRNHILVSHYLVILYINLSLHFNFPSSETKNLFFFFQLINFDSYRVFSTTYVGSDLSDMAMVYGGRTTSLPSQVLTFHSSTKWNEHFDAFKKTNKLVCSETVFWLISVAYWSGEMFCFTFHPKTTKVLLR